MIKMKKTIASLILAASMGGSLAIAAPAQAYDMMYWFGTKSACQTALDKARPGFGSFVRLERGCFKNGNGYAYTVIYRKG